MDEKEEKKAKEASLAKQRAMWERRLKELRGVGVAALDDNFIKRNIIKCKEEIAKIDQILNS